MQFARNTGGLPSAFQKQLRNIEAFHDLARQIPPRRKTHRIVYLASGSHLAPLVICDVLPGSDRCHLTFTEVDPSVREPIAALLAVLARENVIDRLASRRAGNPQSAVWEFRLGRHPVVLNVDVAPAPPRATSPVRASLLSGADLVISHDWSGDPLANLRLIFDYIRAEQSLGKARMPPLMIEDLERHPYPIDLSFFSPVARTSQSYGHRASRDGQVGHDGDELGVPLFGGGVVLGFRGQWWRNAGEGDLLPFLDFLLFNEFDSDRRNILRGGERILVPPAALDWWTGFGRRSIGGGDLFRNPRIRRNMIDAAVKLAPSFDPAGQTRLACRLLLFRTLVDLKAGGFDTSRLLPPAVVAARFEEGLLSPEMKRLFTEAQANEETRVAEKEEEWGAFRGVTRVLEEPAPQAVMSQCPLPYPRDRNDSKGLADLYKLLVAAVR
jgi:hypothetical protein